MLPVVGFDGGLGLFVSHFLEELAHGYHFTCVDVERTELGFGCTRHDGLEYFGNGMYCTIVTSVFRILQAKEMSSDLATCLGFAEIRCVTVHGSYHSSSHFTRDIVCVVGDACADAKVLRATSRVGLPAIA